ncbi:hypothetical protein DY000_02015020 [Brassica cretica]|uniref:Uncharacterized protein n=1 Tax=Brassica cretica TaxID=69181 RepID=A0ABQ7D0Y1_BRACR|nr:hypothetical protein DY000_02015020 [Brassica cretica]
MQAKLPFLSLPMNILSILTGEKGYPALFGLLRAFDVCSYFQAHKIANSQFTPAAVRDMIVALVIGAELWRPKSICQVNRGKRTMVHHLWLVLLMSIHLPQCCYSS